MPARMIDLHCHILPGLDDGPPSYAGSLEMARVAVASGIEVMTATPHVRSDFLVTAGRIRSGVEALNARLSRENIPLRVAAGAEVAVEEGRALIRGGLKHLCLGEGRYVLIESPYGDEGSLLESTLLALCEEGFHPVLAHPERSAAFLRDPARLESLVEAGVLCSITAASISGNFGGRVRDFALDLLAAGRVHNVASDSHDANLRSPSGLRAGLEAADRNLAGMGARATWLADTAPRAIIAGAALPVPPYTGLERRTAVEPTVSRPPRRLGTRLRRRRASHLPESGSSTGV